MEKVCDLDLVREGLESPGRSAGVSADLWDCRSGVTPSTIFVESEAVPRTPLRL